MLRLKLLVTDHTTHIEIESSAQVGYLIFTCHPSCSSCKLPTTMGVMHACYQALSGGRRHPSPAFFGGSPIRLRCWLLLPLLTCPWPSPLTNDPKLLTPKRAQAVCGRWCWCCWCCWCRARVAEESKSNMLPWPSPAKSPCWFRDCDCDWNADSPHVELVLSVLFIA